MTRTEASNGPTSLPADANSKLIQLASRFKDQAFAEENEWRTVLQHAQRAIEFRPVPGLLVPYIPADRKNELRLLHAR